MKKLFFTTIAVVLFATISHAQTAVASPSQSAVTVAAQGAVQASQAVNAADMQGTNTKCGTTNTSCCMHGKTEGSTSATSTSTESSTSESEQCKSVTFGMSAEKPKEVEEKPKN